MKKIILLNFCNGLYGGIESFLLNAFYCMEKDKYDVYFVTCGKSTYDMHKNDIIARGGHVDEIPILANSLSNKQKVYNALREYFKKEKADIVHINSGTLSLHYIASLAASKEKVPRIIAHAHNFLPNKTGLKEKLKGGIKRKLASNANSYLACSTGAAKWIFPEKLFKDNKIVIIPNGVDTQRFLFSPEKRLVFRKEFGVDNDLMIGNIGRFQGQKNHVFMIDIMSEVVKINPNAKLYLAGAGNLKDEIQAKVREKQLSDNIIFMGERKDMDAFLSAIDVFILPSLYEGLPIASIEAQASGAKVLLADTITPEANITGDAIYLSINKPDDAKKWADEICRLPEKNDRLIENRKVFEAGFDVHTCYKKMISIYDEETMGK